MSRPPKKLRRYVWQGAILIGVGVAAWRYIDWVEVGTSLTGIGPGWLAFLLLLATADRLAMGGKWLQLLQALGHGATLRTTVTAYYQAAFLHRFMPNSLGADAVRAFVVVRRHGHASGVLATMVVEKLVAMVAALLIAAIGILLAMTQIRDTGLQWLLLLVPLLIGISFLGLRLTRHRAFMERVIDWLPAGRWRAYLHRVYEQYVRLAVAERVLAVNLLYALLEQALQVVFLTACAVALAVDAPVLTIVAAISVAQSVRKFAILLESWVIGEFTVVAICGLFGIPASQALAFALLSYVVDFLAALPGGVLFAGSASTLRDIRSWRGLGDRAAGEAPGVRGPAADSGHAPGSGSGAGGAALTGAVGPLRRSR